MILFVLRFRNLIHRLVSTDTVCTLLIVFVSEISTARSGLNSGSSSLQRITCFRCASSMLRVAGFAAASAHNLRRCSRANAHSTSTPAFVARNRTVWHLTHLLAPLLLSPCEGWKHALLSSGADRAQPNGDDVETKLEESENNIHFTTWF